MMYYRSSLLTTIALLATLATAVLTTLKARDDHPSQLWTCGPGCAHTVFDDSKATCGTDKTLNSLSTTKAVIVQPDCDTVIDIICKASDKLASGGTMSNLAHTFGTCEGHMLFPGFTPDTSTMSYAACVSGFQSVTESCVLSASIGKQFGVLNVMYQADANNQNWKASNMWQKTMPGYLIGPPGVWGTDNWGQSEEANVVLNPQK